MLNNKGKTLTTGQISRILDVAPRTVSGWCDSGKLKHFRIPTSGRIDRSGQTGKGSPDRRVMRQDLFQFCRDNNIPLHLLAGLSKVCMIVTHDHVLAKDVTAGFSGDVIHASTTFMAGLRLRESAILVVDMHVGRSEGLEIASHSDMPTFLLAGEDEVDFSELGKVGTIMIRPFSSNDVIDAIEMVLR